MSSVKTIEVAVVILNYNGEEHLAKFLPSVVENTPSWVDIVVADNGSTDGSCELLRREFADRVKIFSMDHNWGFAEGYNRVLATLTQDIFVLLNSDVEVPKGWVEPLVEALVESDDIAVVGSKLLSYTDPRYFEYAGAAGGYIDYLGYPFCRGRVLSSVERDEGQYDDARDLFWVSGAAFGCRASSFREVGGFDGDLFAHMEEIDLCWRLQLRGYRVRVEPRSVVYHLGGGTLAAGSARKCYLNHRNNLAMLYKCAPPMQRFVVAIVRPVLDLVTAFGYLAQGRWRSSVAVVEAWRDFLWWHRDLAEKRREVRSEVVRESLYIYRGSILLRRLLGR